MKRPSLFAKAAETPAKLPDPEAARWVVPLAGPEAMALRRWHNRSTQLKELETALAEDAEIIAKYGVTKFMQHLASFGTRPASIKIAEQNFGKEVTFVVSESSRKFGGDKARRESPEDEVANVIAAAAGRIPTDELVAETVNLTFNEDVLAESVNTGRGTVKAWIETELTAVLKKAVKSRKITQRQADELIQVETVTKMVPGWITRVAAQFKGDLPTIAWFMAKLKPTISLKA